MQILLLLVAGLHVVVDGIWSHLIVKVIDMDRTRAVRQEEAFPLSSAFNYSDKLL